MGRGAPGTATAADLEDVHGRLHRWARVVRTQAMAALAETITIGEELPARVSAPPGRAGADRPPPRRRAVPPRGHRRRPGATALATWLRRRIAEARAGDEDQDRARRLESDHLAVQVLTVHRSKGLEFPIVYLPDLWDVVQPRKNQPAAFHDSSGDRRLDVGLLGRDYQQHVLAKIAEERGEDLRLLYVALTRARHQAVMWWAGANMASCAPLTRLLLDRAADGAIGLGLDATPSDKAMTDALREVAAGSRPHQRRHRDVGRRHAVRAGSRARVGARGPALPPRRSTTRGGAPPTPRWRPTPRSIACRWARRPRTSCSPTSLPPTRRPPRHARRRPSATGDAGGPRGRHGGPSRSRAGRLRGGRPPGRTARAPAERDRPLRTGLGALPDVAAGLAAALATPVGPVLDGRALTSIPRADRLDELAFELPLAGGDAPSGHVTLGRLAAELQHHLAPDDPLREYADLLATPGIGGSFRGYLTGTIDLVCRWRAENGRWRFALADYKTNRLPDYGQAAMLAEMQDKHYVLQALIYLVALHRHLRARLPGYDADRDLAGAAYLFVRGMSPDADPGDGVVAWQPSSALLDAMSGAFDG